MQGVEASRHGQQRLQGVALRARLGGRERQQGQAAGVGGRGRWWSSTSTSPLPMKRQGLAALQAAGAGGRGREWRRAIGLDGRGC